MKTKQTWIFLCSRLPCYFFVVYLTMLPVATLHSVGWWAVSRKCSEWSGRVLIQVGSGICEETRGNYGTSQAGYTVSHSRPEPNTSRIRDKSVTATETNLVPPCTLVYPHKRFGGNFCCNLQGRWSQAVHPKVANYQIVRRHIPETKFSRSRHLCSYSRIS
jgi:hypothetical protein